MHHFQTKSFCLFFALLLPMATHTHAQTPAPKENVPFSLLLADGTTATAVFLPTADGQAYLVYSTPTGKLGFWMMTTKTPEPTPTPNPPPDPTPQKLTIAIVEDPEQTTAAQRRVLIDDEWRDAAAGGHDFKGILPSDLKDPKTGEAPPVLAPFLKAAEGQSLPWVMFYNRSGKLVFSGPLPATGAELTALIRKYGGK